jgi:hypothetical protein
MMTTSVVRGGGEEMKKALLPIAMSLMVALMLAQPVSAGYTAVVVQDRQGDVGKMYDLETCDVTVLWGENTVIADVGYFDALSYSLSLKGKTFTFGMELAAALPDEGVALPSGIKHVAYTMWIDAAPWHPVYNPTPSLFTVVLNYDGLEYSAVLIEGEKILGNVLEILPFTVQGTRFEVQFPAASIGSLEAFWWCPCVHVWDGPVGTEAQWWFDTADPDAYPGQVWWNIPWSIPGL